MPSPNPTSFTASIAGPLMLGSRGKSVETLQALMAQALAPAPALVKDGVFGVKTDSAVRAFQSRKGLLPDGIVGANTARALGATFVAQPQPAPTPNRPGTSPLAATSVPAAALLAVVHKTLKQVQERIDLSFDNGFDEHPEVFSRARKLLKFSRMQADSILAGAMRSGLDAGFVAAQTNVGIQAMAGGLGVVAGNVTQGGGDASEILSLMHELRARSARVADVVRTTLNGQLDGGLRAGLTLLHDLLDPLTR